MKTRNEAIELLLPLVNEQAARQARTRDLREELAGVGNVALVEAVHRGLDKGLPIDPIGELRSFVRAAVRNRITDYVAENALIGPSARSRRQKRSQGVETPPLKQAHPDTLDYLPDKDAKSTDDTRGLIDHCCESPLETQVIELRSRGLVDAEISERLSVSPSSVYRSRKRVEARYEEACQSLSA